jgi:hypothetical protein
MEVFSEASNHPVSILMPFLQLPSSEQKQGLSSCTTEDTIFLVEGWWGHMCLLSDMFKVTLTTEFQLSTSLNFHYGQLL